MPLRDELREIGQRLVDWFKRPTGSTDTAPYQVYVYPPAREWDVRRDLGELASWLARPEQGIASVSISLADVLWQALDETGWTDELFVQERDAAGDPATQAEVHKAVAELLRRPTPLSQRVINEVHERTAEIGPAAVFLYRAGSLYPSFRTSGLLDDLRSRLTDVPVTMLYPGELQGEFGLRFMGKWEPTYNYRALIVDGTAR
jgi:hypothetical protein